MNGETTVLDAVEEAINNDPQCFHAFVSGFEVARAVLAALSVDPTMLVERLRADLAIAQRARATGLYNTGTLGVTAPGVAGYVLDAAELRAYILGDAP